MVRWSSVLSGIIRCAGHLTWTWVTTHWPTNINTLLRWTSAPWLSIALVQAGHEIKLSCHQQQSADQSADRLSPIAKLSKAPYWNRVACLFSCFLCRPHYNHLHPPPPLMLLWPHQCHCDVIAACSVLGRGGLLLFHVCAFFWCSGPNWTNFFHKYNNSITSSWPPLMSAPVQWTVHSSRPHLVFRTNCILTGRGGADHRLCRWESIDLQTARLCFSSKHTAWRQISSLLLCTIRCKYVDTIQYH